MARYAIWDKKSAVITPIGEVLTAEQWVERYPIAAIDTIKVVCAGGEINGAFFGTLGQMVETYAVKVDPELHKEVLVRYEKLHLAPYKGFVNPVYTAETDAEGRITNVTVSYDEGYAEQMLRYSKDYANLPFRNE